MRTFQIVTSIHPYSLGLSNSNVGCGRCKRSGVNKNMSGISNAELKVRAADSKLSAAQISKQFGFILNPQLCQFTGVPTKAEGSSQGEKAEVKPVLRGRKESVDTSELKEPSAKEQSFKEPISKEKYKEKDKEKARPASARMSHVGGLAAAFGKSKKPPKNPQERVIVGDHEGQQDAEGDIDMEEMDELAHKQKTEERKRKHEKLKQMFDGDDNEMVSPEKEPVVDTTMEERDDLQETDKQGARKDKPPKSEPEPSEVLHEAPPGRRRGRRKVQKKVTKTDKRGYLVTKIEEVWEDFSENEKPPEPPKKVVRPSQLSAQKPQKPKGANQQSTLLSFFKK